MNKLAGRWIFGVGVVALFLTVTINTDVRAQTKNFDLGALASLTCSQASIAKSFVWMQGEVSVAEKMQQKYEKAEWYNENRIWRDFMTAKNNALLATHTYESLVLQCSILEKLGVGI